MKAVLQSHNFQYFLQTRTFQTRFLPMRLAAKHYGYVNEIVTIIGDFTRIRRPQTAPLSLYFQQNSDIFFYFEAFPHNSSRRKMKF